MFNQSSPRSFTWLHRYRSSNTFLIVTVCVAIFNDVFLFGTIIPILPYALPERIHVKPENVQLYISILLGVYGGALMVGAVLFGWLGDQVKRRHAIFFSGLCTLLGATLLLAFGRHIAFLIVGRILQGLSAAVVWTSGLALLNDLLGVQRAGEAMGYASMGTSAGTTSAPLLGGLVYSYGGYHAVSLMSLMTVSVAIILAALLVEPRCTQTLNVQYQDGVNGSAKGKAKSKDHVRSGPGDDVLDVAPNVDEHTSLLPRQDFDNSRSIYLLLLKSPRILAALGGIFTYSFVMLSMEGMIPLYVKDTFNWGSFQAALTFLSWIIPSFLSPLAGKVSDRFGSRWFAVCALLFSVPPLILLRLVTYNSTGQKLLLCALLSLVGFGFTWIMTSCLPDLSAAAAEIKRNHYGRSEESEASSQSFGLFVLSYSMGGLLGPPITAILKTKVNWGTATLILACVCICTSIPIAFKTSAVPRRPKNPTASTAEDIRGVDEP